MTKLFPLITEFTNNPTGMSVLILGGLLQVLFVMIPLAVSDACGSQDARVLPVRGKSRVLCLAFYSSPASSHLDPFNV